MISPEPTDSRLNHETEYVKRSPSGLGGTQKDAIVLLAVEASCLKLSFFACSDVLKFFKLKAGVFLRTFKAERTVSKQGRL